MLTQPAEACCQPPAPQGFDRQRADIHLVSAQCVPQEGSPLDAPTLHEHYCLGQDQGVSQLQIPATLRQRTCHGSKRHRVVETLVSFTRQAS